MQFAQKYEQSSFQNYQFKRRLQSLYLNGFILVIKFTIPKTKKVDMRLFRVR